MELDPFSLDDRIEAAARISLPAVSLQSLQVGFFRMSGGRWNPKHFVGAVFESTPHGEFLVPAWSTPKSSRRLDVLTSPWIGDSRQSLDFCITYDPSGTDGRGFLAASLGFQTARLFLRGAAKGEGAILNRFGVVGGSDSARAGVRLDEIQILKKID